MKTPSGSGAGKGVKNVTRAEMKETLEKQLQLLHERSENANGGDLTGLAEITRAMCTLVETITQVFRYDS